MLAIFDQLDQDRFEPHVVCREAGPLTDELDRRQIQWHALAELDRPIRPVNDFRAYRALGQLFRKHQFQIVHTHSSKPGLLGRLAARKVGVPITVHHVHAFAFHEFSPASHSLLYSAVERFAARFCDHMLFVNHEERKFVIERGWLPDARCTTVYNGVDLDRPEIGRQQGERYRFRARHDIGEHETVILFNGRLAYPKQPLLLADIAVELVRLRPSVAWRLVVVGSGDGENALRRRVLQLGVADRVSMLGWHEDQWPALCAADIALQTSLAEGGPIALNEAHAAYLPSVASNAKGNREVVTPQTGFLCDPKNPVAYASQLVRLVDDPLLRARMGKAARRRAELTFDTIANNQRIVQVYEELLAEKGIHRGVADKTHSTIPQRRAA